MHHYCLLPFLWQLIIFLVSFLTLFLLSGFVFGFLFCLEHWFPTNLGLKVFHIAHLPRDPPSPLEAVDKERGFFSRRSTFCTKSPKA